MIDCIYCSRRKWKGWEELPAAKEGHTGTKPDYQKFMYELIDKNKPKTILEIGFNAGHSACCFLNASPTAKMVTFDICRHETEKLAEEVLKEYFDITLIEGDSTRTIPNYFKENPNYNYYNYADRIWNHIAKFKVLSGVKLGED